MCQFSGFCHFQKKGLTQIFTHVLYCHIKLAIPFNHWCACTDESQTILCITCISYGQSRAWYTFLWPDDDAVLSGEAVCGQPSDVPGPDLDRIAQGVDESEVRGAWKAICHHSFQPLGRSILHAQIYFCHHYTTKRIRWTDNVVLMALPVAVLLTDCWETS